MSLTFRYNSYILVEILQTIGLSNNLQMSNDNFEILFLFLKKLKFPLFVIFFFDEFELFA